MGIAGVEPRQLAPTVGRTGSGSTDSPAPPPTTAKINIDTIVGIVAPINVDTSAKIDIDTIVGIAAPINVDTSAKIDIDTIVGIAAPAVIDTNPTESEVDVVESAVIDSASPSIANLTPVANVIDPTSGTIGAVPGGYDMAFRLFNFHVDSDGAMELISIGDSALLKAETTTPPAIGGKPPTNALMAPSEEESKLRTSTPSVGSNDFEDPPPSPTTAYCVDCDAYHYVGAGDFSSHEIASCEDPRGARQLSTRQYPSASGLSTPSRSVLRHMIPTTSKGYTRTTHAQTMTMTSTPRLRGKLAPQQAPAHQANLPHQATATRPITILTS
jgi:hypothetical protein